MSLDPVTLLLAIPAVAALLIALLPGSKASATLNAGASFLTFVAALSLLWIERPAPGAYLLVDEFSTIFVVLINFVSFTTSVFSATYVAHEVDTGRVTPAFLQALSRALSGADARLQSRSAQQQYRHHVGRHRARHAHHGDHGRHLPHPCGDRGGLEIFHPRLASASRSLCSAPSSSIWRQNR